MLLIVVVLAEFVVFVNCLVQLIDVKVVNGIQQFVLKFFFLEENNCFEFGGFDGGNFEYMIKKGLNEREKMVFVE